MPGCGINMNGNDHNYLETGRNISFRSSEKHYKKSVLHKPCGRPPKRQLFGIYYRMRVTFPPTRKASVSTNTKADLMHNRKMAEERSNNSPYNRT